MIDREHKLPIKRQSEVLGISRGTVYYHPEPVSEAELTLMRRIDELHLEIGVAIMLQSTPSSGSSVSAECRSATCTPPTR